MASSQIMSVIEKMVSAKARDLHLISHIPLDREDIQQELMLNVLKSLERFDIKHGNLLSFVKLILAKRSIDIQKATFADKRRIILKSESISDQTSHCDDGRDILQELIEQRELEQLPRTYQDIILMLRTNKLKDIKERLGLSASEVKKIVPSIRKVLESQEKCLLRIKEEMKNISCIELLDAHELVKLSEFDLSDLSEKIDFTYDWVKKLKQKLETAILKKYTTEALEAIHKNGSSFGIAVLNKNGYNVEVEIPKMIIWDQDKLRGIYKLCPREVKTIISVTYSVDEGAYEQLGEESKNMLGKAMTTRYGKVKVKITKENKK